MDELDLMGNAELFSSAFRMLGVQQAQVDADAEDAVNMEEEKQEEVVRNFDNLTRFILESPM